LFRFTPRDFDNTRPNKTALQELKSRFLILQTILLDRLPSEFRHFKRKGAHYVCRIVRQTGGLRSEIWLGIADGQVYSDPRKGIQFQFGINRDNACVYGIWIEGTYAARSARLKIANRLSKQRDEFFRVLRTLPSNHWLRFITKDLDEYKYIRIRSISDSDVDELIHVLPQRNTYVEVGPSFTMTGSSLTRRDIIAIRGNIADHVAKTFTRLLPLYRFLSEEREELTKPRAGRPLSTQIIHESSTWGMKMAMQFERENGRKPKDVSLTTEGYDISSKDSRGKTRCIEVKSRRGGHRVTLTPHEYETAKREADKYYLYVVRSDGSIWIVRDPARKCRFEEIEVTEFEAVNWIEKAARHSLAGQRKLSVV